MHLTWIPNVGGCTKKLGLKDASLWVSCPIVCKPSLFCAPGCAIVPMDEICYCFLPVGWASSKLPGTD